MIAVTIALICGLAGCVSDEEHARENWVPAVDLTNLQGLRTAAEAVRTHAADVNEQLAERNFGRARSASMALTEASNALTELYVPLVAAKQDVGAAFKYLRMGESERARATIASASESVERASTFLAEARPDAPATRAVAGLAGQLTEIRTEIEGAHNVSRYRLEEVASKLDRLLATPPPGSDASSGRSASRPQAPQPQAP